VDLNTAKVAATFRSELVSTLYKCSIHGCWLTLRELDTSEGRFRFWQCPTFTSDRKRCQKCKPCKNRSVGWNVQ
jgi:hypothetical protein